ncbi:MAG: hypothetical protein WDZ28_01505 [Simkaniaceae bacterium]
MDLIRSLDWDQSDIKGFESGWCHHFKESEEAFKGALPQLVSEKAGSTVFDRDLGFALSTTILVSILAVTFGIIIPLLIMNFLTPITGIMILLVLGVIASASGAMSMDLWLTPSSEKVLEAFRQELVDKIKNENDVYRMPAKIIQITDDCISEKIPLEKIRLGEMLVEDTYLGLRIFETQEDTALFLTLREEAIAYKSKVAQVKKACLKEIDGLNFDDKEGSLLKGRVISLINSYEDFFANKIEAFYKEQKEQISGELIEF